MFHFQIKKNYRSDKKWRKYLNFCEYFYFVAPEEVIEIIKEEVPKHVGLYTYCTKISHLECIRPSRRHKKDLCKKDTKEHLFIKMGYRFTKMHSDKKKNFLNQNMI